MTQITVNVTQDHIDRGKPSDCGECPIALAISDAVPDATHVEVWWAYADKETGEDIEDVAGAAIWLERGTLNGRLGDIADAFIAAFDRSQPVEPFTFTITIPAEAS